MVTRLRIPVRPLAPAPLAKRHAPPTPIQNQATTVVPQTSRTTTLLRNGFAIGLVALPLAGCGNEMADELSLSSAIASTLQISGATLLFQFMPGYSFAQKCHVIAATSSCAVLGQIGMTTASVIQGATGTMFLTELLSVSALFLGATLGLRIGKPIDHWRNRRSNERKAQHLSRLSTEDREFVEKCNRNNGYTFNEKLAASGDFAKIVEQLETWLKNDRGLLEDFFGFDSARFDLAEVLSEIYITHSANGQPKLSDCYMHYIFMPSCTR